MASLRKRISINYDDGNRGRKSCWTSRFFVLVAAAAALGWGDTSSTIIVSAERQLQVSRGFDNVRQTVPTVQCSLTRQTVPLRITEEDTTSGEEPIIFPTENKKQNKKRRRKKKTTEQMERRRKKENKHNDNQATRKLPFRSSFGSNFKTYQVRGCWCAEYYGRPTEFCPARFDTCRVEGSTGRVSCFSKSEGHSFARSIWPVGLFSLAAVAFALVTTEPGANARRFLRRKLSPCFSRILCGPRCTSTEEEILARDINFLLTQRREQVSRLYQRAILREHRSLRLRFLRWQREGENSGADPTPHPTISLPELCNALELKTKFYEPQESENDCTRDSVKVATLPSASQDLEIAEVKSANETGKDDNDKQGKEYIDDETQESDQQRSDHCAICLGKLERGDCIGDIPCGHVFHKECLKDWLRCKNKCPLCQQSGIAALRYQYQQDDT